MTEGTGTQGGTAELPAKHTLGSTFTNIPVSGTIANGGGSFTGTATITQFASRGGQLVAVGTLSGTLLDALDNVIGTVAHVAFTSPSPLRAPVRFSRSTLARSTSPCSA